MPIQIDKGSSMSQQIRHQLWILAAAAVVFFTFLGSTALWDEDEPLYASCAREMMDRGDWVVPVFNGRMFPDKPPLMFWLMIAGFELFGQNEFAARFFSAVLGVGTALLTYHLGRLLFNSRVGLWSGLIVASSIIFTVSARAATVDSALAFVTTLAMLCFVWAMRVQGSGVSGQGNSELGTQNEEQGTIGNRFCVLRSAFCVHPSSLIPYLFFLLLYLCLGVAILAKGPIGFLLPMAVMGFYLMIVKVRCDNNSQLSNKWLALLNIFRPMNFLKSLWQLRPITGIIVMLAVALPWYIMVGMRTDGAWLEQFFAKFNWRPFTQPILGHSGPIWYYIPAILIGFFPWSAFLGPAAIDTVRRVRDRDPWRDSYLLLSCWFGVFFVFWSICSTKLPHYVLPAYPALALLTGGFLESWIHHPARVGPSWMKNAWITTMVIGVGIIIAVGIVAWIYLPGEELIGLAGMILVVGGGLCMYYAKRRYRRRAAVIFAAMSVIFITAIFGFAAQRVDRHQNAKRLLTQIRGDSAESVPICAYRFFRQSMVYYSGHPVQYCDTPEQLQEFVEKSPKAYIITLDKYEKEIEHKQPGQFRVLARERRFLAADDMVVLAPGASIDNSHTATRPPLNRE
jgi:4-amino-4-deoxy-L-arabinose transferase-like glycosyltransferase